MGETVLVLVIYVLAGMRLTRLFNSDTVLDKPRIWLAKTFGPASPVIEFFSCPWCVGMWVALIGAAPVAAVLSWPWWSVIPAGLACSQIVGMAAPLFNDDDLEFETVSGD